MSSSSTSRWDVLACVAMQGDFSWCNCLSFLDLGSISRHIACVSLGRRHKISHLHGAGDFFYGSIVNACHCIIVTVNGSRWLWVAKFY